MRTTGVPRRSTVSVACLLAVTALALAACGSTTTGASTDASGAAASTSPSSAPSAVAEAPTGPTMAQPAVLKQPPVSPDILVNGADTLPKATVDAIRALPGVVDVDTFTLAQFYYQEQQFTYAAVDPATFRRFTPAGSAKTQDVWDRVADGEMAIDPDVAKQVQDAQGYVQLGNDTGSPKVHVGAYATLVKRALGDSVIDAVVNEKWASRLHLKQGNALLISTGEAAPQKLQKQLTALLGTKATAQILAVNLPVGAYQTAVLTGGSVSQALGTLRYTANGNGTVNPDPAWVADNIRTEQVPIIGTVRCNKVMLPELRAALTEIVQRGLADKIHPSEYGGCFVPRYIAGTTQLSFHTFGTAIDLNVPGNERGTVGQMDRTVVSIFKKWGFAWGGDWGYTDPMHFELHRIVKAG